MSGHSAHSHGGPGQPEPKLSTRDVQVFQQPPEALAQVEVRRADVRRIYRQVKRMGNPVESASAWAYTWLGVAGAAGLSLATLYGAKGEPKVENWVLDVNWITFAVGLFLAVFCWWFDRQNRRKRTTDKDLVLRELEAMDPGCVEETTDEEKPSLWQRFKGVPQDRAA